MERSALALKRHTALLLERHGRGALRGRFAVLEQDSLHCVKVLRTAVEVAGIHRPAERAAVVVPLKVGVARDVTFEVVKRVAVVLHQGKLAIGAGVHVYLEDAAKLVAVLNDSLHVRGGVVR